MESIHSFWQLGDELRGQLKVSEDHKWLVAASKLAEQTRPKLSVGLTLISRRVLLNKMNENVTKNSPRNVIYNMNPIYQNPNASFAGNAIGGKYTSINNSKEHNNNNSSNNSNNKEDSTNASNAVEKRFKTLPAAEMLPGMRGFMSERTFGLIVGLHVPDALRAPYLKYCLSCCVDSNCLPPRYRDSVRAITPGLPLFLYNYTTHQLHGIFEAATFGGTNIDPTAWEDKKCKGESRFPAQVRIRVRKICKPLEEDAFRPVLHHYDGPKFRLELSVPELSISSYIVYVYAVVLVEYGMWIFTDFPWSASFGANLVVRYSRELGLARVQ
ncbi:UNVERIFIED_CONTAM: B2 protein [Sesamum latifolium]|uniref:B2 protein n=1 Tax=Sesamum latifolium TaxID=2727402 RepID=A0AAW2Y823_9LAMI